ncbi:SMC-Scp complex subunit ScpB [Micromonospora sp. LZ34]
MSNEERRDSLADQAAAWVPPWQRPTPPAAEQLDPIPPAPEQADPTPPVPEQLDPTPPVDLGERRPLEGPESSKISRDREAVSGAEAVPVPEPGTAEEVAAGQAPAEAASAGESGAGGVPKKGAGGRRRATLEPAPVELSDAELRGALEAILLVVDEPVSELILADVLEQPAERVGPMLAEIAAGYTAAGYGFELRRAAGGWRLYTRPEYAGYVERFVLDGQSVRLTQAALETLAVVAYKQPVTRSRISAIRGVNCDGVIRTLVSRGLVEECGTEPDSGAFLYRTTTMFLEKLGLNSLDELPPLAPFLPDDVEELADAT